MEPQGMEDPDQTGQAGIVDRRARDGMDGAGDMLGGTSVGVGDSLGLDDAEEAESEPISGRQHDLNSGEPRTDSATSVHPAGNTAEGGGDEFQGYGGAEGNEGA